AGLGDAGGVLGDQRAARGGRPRRGERRPRARGAGPGGARGALPGRGWATGGGTSPGRAVPVVGNGRGDAGPPRHGAGPGGCTVSGPAVVALGDSITAGVGDAVGPDAAHGPGWAAHLALLADSARFENLARNGARTQTVIAEQLDLALASGADLATLVIGGNDALRSDFSPADVARRLTICVDAL